MRWSLEFVSGWGSDEMKGKGPSPEEKPAIHSLEPGGGGFCRVIRMVLPRGVIGCGEGEGREVYP